MSPIVRATCVVAVLLASGSAALAQPKPVSIDEFGKLSLSVSAEKTPGVKTPDVPLPSFGLYKWRDELHDLSSAPASLPTSFYSELRTALASFPTSSKKLPSVDGAGALRFPFRLRFKPQHADAIDVSGVLLYAEKHFSLPKDAAYDEVRPVLSLLLAQWELQTASDEDRAKTQHGVARIQGGELVLVDDSYKVKSDTYALEAADPSLGRLLETLDGHTVNVRVVLDTEKKTARVLSLVVHSKAWKAPVTAKDGSRIELVSTAYDKSDAGLEVTGIDANGAATVWTPVGPGTLPSNLLTLGVDPRLGSFFSWSPKVESLELCELVKKMPAPSKTTGVLGALGRP